MESEVKKYNIIYADPPWKYKNGLENGRNAERHYPTQSIEYLKSLNIPAIAQDSCVLMMWATFPCLLDAFALGSAWGFFYKTVAFVWIKKYKYQERLFVGLGHYTRANAEIVLLFTKGKPLKRISNNVEQVLISKRGQHSVKPPEIRDRIIQIYGDLPRIELFARSRKGFFPDYEYEGWDVFGNQVNQSIVLPG
ncbi:MAG: adenine methyltransferase [Sphingobacteriia bacterium]|nr:adenine methyltransferase [Sphingobacteriia bacterium]